LQFGRVGWDKVLIQVTLDSGGASGLSSLMILDENMDRLHHALGLAGPLDIHDHFDVVAGTGTGA
jgi:patatin-like phospholipase/acyl hydrolase